MISVYRWDCGQKKGAWLEAAVLRDQAAELRAGADTLWIDLENPTPEEEALVFHDTQELLMSALMNNVYWALGKKKYTNYSSFVAAVTDYNKKISPGDAGWDPNRQISKGAITVVYEAEWKDEDDTIKIKIGEPKKALTMGRVLFALNNATVDFFKDADHQFFEGLALLGGTKYELMVGS